MQKFTYCITYNKLNWMRYISHLDLMRLFHRALRRAGFKPYLTKGFNPRPVIRIRKALKLGLVAEDQEAEFVLSEHVRPGEFRKRLEEELPEGIEITNAWL